MTNALIHFAAGTAGAFVIFLIFERLAGVTRFSMPFGLVVVGLACASGSHYVSPWATPAILLLYALGSLGEFQQDRAARRAAAARAAAEGRTPGKPEREDPVSDD